MVRSTNHSGLLPKNMIPITRTCIDCGKKFSISIGEQKFFAAHELHVPKIRNIKTEIPDCILSSKFPKDLVNKFV